MTNKHKKYGDTVIITVKREDGEPFKVRIDAKDYDKVDSFKRVFRIKGRCGGSYFAVCTARDEYGRREVVMLNRLVMGTPEDEYCIFLNGDTTDCRRANLENRKRLLPTMRKGKPLRPQYIYWCDVKRRWHVKVWDADKVGEEYAGKHIGYFADMGEAVAARDKALKEREGK